MSHKLQILTVEQMYEADKRAVEHGASGVTLMENAGQGVTAFIEEGWDLCNVAVLCGPGNNGGDGYVIARALSEAGWSVAVYAFGDISTLSGDAKYMFDKFDGQVEPIASLNLTTVDLVVDAVFGAGFRGTLPLEIGAVFKEIQENNLSVVCVDVPSGMNGNTGAVDDTTLHADLCVSFCRPKTGHFFYPGQSYLGRFEVIDIGIPELLLQDMELRVFDNDPDLWISQMPVLSPTGHKYHRGHGAVVGGGLSSMGASRIASRNALRSGAGAVTLITPPSALMAYSISLDAVMVKSIDEAQALEEWLKEKRIKAILIGPGNGVSTRTRTLVEIALKSDCNVVLDADALTVFADDPDVLFDLISKKSRGEVVLTPHEAEFARIFSLEGSALERCQDASVRSGAVVVLKGASTVIAEPMGRASINTNAPPWLATAGSGDALAGIIMGLITASMPIFEAAAAGVWMHGEAAQLFGPGLTSEDIETIIPNVFNVLGEDITSR